MKKYIFSCFMVLLCLATTMTGATAAPINGNGDQPFPTHVIKITMHVGETQDFMLLVKGFSYNHKYFEEVANPVGVTSSIRLKAIKVGDTVVNAGLNKYDVHIIA